MELLYIVLLGAIVWQVVLFILLSIPSPRGWKSSIAQMLSRNRTTQIFLLAHLSLCLIAGLLFADCYRMENKYRAERDFLIQNKNVGTDIRISELSYKMLLVQRNKYISFMTIFVILFLNIYITLLRYLYNKKESFEARKIQADSRKQAVSAVTEGSAALEGKKNE